TLPALKNTRKMLEIDWQNGRPIATTTRYGLGYVISRSAPLPPQLLSPPNGATNQPTTLVMNWNAAAMAASYGIQVSTDSLFGIRVLDDSAVTGTSRQVGPLSGTTTYYWRVNSRNAIGAGSYSTVWHFTTSIAPPSAPALLSPGNNATGLATTLTCRWDSSSG